MTKPGVTKPVAEQLAPLEALLKVASPSVRRIVEREVRQAIGKAKAERRSSLSDSNRAAIRLRVLERQRDLGWLKPPENVPHFTDREAE